jgi:DNA-binding NtrC family response regulator
MKKIIFVDDDKDMLKLLNIIMGSSYEVHLLSDASQLENYIRELKPDLLVLDNLIGDHNSESIIQHLQLNNNIQIPPFILHSGTADLAERANRIKATGYLPKPSSITEIKSYIDNLLSRT